MMKTLAFKDAHDGYYQIQLEDGQSPPSWTATLTPCEVTPPTLSADQVAIQFTAAIQQRLDSFAQTRNYDNILSACTYATSTVAKFKTEGQACVNLRDATWAAAYAILAEVQAGDRAMPQNLDDIEADLPALVWP